MARTLTTDDAARLARRVARRRADGSRGPRARRAWRRLVRACAAGDPAAQDAVRDIASGLPETDVLELLAAGPDEPAGQAAYLTLIGQSAQRRALDPDGSLLSLAYRAAVPEIRERLRTVMAAEGDGEAVRVAVIGDSRDRVAEMSTAELNYLGHQFAEHGRWDDLRRLALDLPLAEAVAMARLLPERERTGDSAAALAALAERSPEELRSTTARLPRDELIEHKTRGECLAAQVSFSPDTTELAVLWRTFRNASTETQVETLQIATGKSAQRFSKSTLGDGDSYTMLHLGQEILIRRNHYKRPTLYHATADGRIGRRPLPSVAGMSRSSRGAVMAGYEKLIFADCGVRTPRFQELPWLRETKKSLLSLGDYQFALTTLPSARLIALFNCGEVLVMDEEGTLLHKFDTGEADWRYPALSFLSANSLALHRYAYLLHTQHGEKLRQRTEIWKLPAKGTPRRTDVYKGLVLRRRPLDTWRGLRLDDTFTCRILTANSETKTMYEGIVPRPTKRTGPAGDARPHALGVAPWGDIIVTTDHFPKRYVRVHSPRLPFARASLEQPLVRSTPQDLLRVRELRAGIGDPSVREALDLLAICLAERFGGDIALGTGPVGAGGPADIALGEDREG